TDTQPAAPRREASEPDGAVADAVTAFEAETVLNAMRTTELFPPVSDDDINLSPEDLACGYGSEEASNDESDDEMELPEPMCYVNEVDSSDSEDGDVDVSFDVPDNTLCSIASGGWKLFDEDHSGK
ncbi:hypothetical protein F441_01871, partial [Phytophthora nicotianae CJ01A1]